MTDAQPGEAGFMDRENKLGAEWSPELMTALKVVPRLRATLFPALL